MFYQMCQRNTIIRGRHILKKGGKYIFWNVSVFIYSNIKTPELHASKDVSELFPPINTTRK